MVGGILDLGYIRRNTTPPPPRCLQKETNMGGVLLELFLFLPWLASSFGLAPPQTLVRDFASRPWGGEFSISSGSDLEYGSTVVLDPTGWVVAVGMPLQRKVMVFRIVPGGGGWVQVGQNITHSTVSSDGIYGNESSFGWSISLSAGGKRVAVGSPTEYVPSPSQEDFNGRARVYEMTEGSTSWVQLGDDIVHTYAMDEFLGSSLSLSGDGTQLLVLESTTFSRILRYVYDQPSAKWTTDGKIIFSVQSMCSDGLQSFVVSRDWRRMSRVCLDGVVSVLTIPVDGTVADPFLFQVEILPGKLSVSISNDGRCVVGDPSKGLVRVYDVTGQLLLTIQSNETTFGASVSISADGSRIAVSTDKGVPSMDTLSLYVENATQLGGRGIWYNVQNDFSVKGRNPNLRGPMSGVQGIFSGSFMGMSDDGSRVVRCGGNLLRMLYDPGMVPRLYFEPLVETTTPPPPSQAATTTSQAATTTSQAASTTPIPSSQTDQQPETTPTASGPSTSTVAAVAGGSVAGLVAIAAGVSYMFFHPALLAAPLSFRAAAAACEQCKGAKVAELDTSGFFKVKVDLKDV